MTTTTTVHWVEILAKFWLNFSMYVIIGEFYNFSQILELLNIISDQFMDCNAIIDHYTHGSPQIGPKLHLKA